MRITGVNTTLYLFELNRCMGDANSPAGRNRGTGCIVELDTDAGLTGIGLGGGGVRPQIASLVEGMLVGEDPRSAQGLWKRMVDKHFKGGHDGLINEAISVLDMAIWDLRAKANNEPLWKTLGGSRPRVHCYASGIEIPMSDETMSEWYAGMAREYGLAGGKLKVGLDQDADMRRIGLMRDALKIADDNPMLMIDANEYWSPKQAIRKVREMEEEYDITWVEEPARRWDFLGLRRIKDSVRSRRVRRREPGYPRRLPALLPSPERRCHSGQLRHGWDHPGAADCGCRLRLRAAHYPWQCSRTHPYPSGYRDAQFHDHGNLQRRAAGWRLHDRCYGEGRVGDPRR